MPMFIEGVQRGKAKFPPGPNLSYWMKGKAAKLERECQLIPLMRAPNVFIGTINIHSDRIRGKRQWNVFPAL